MSTKLILIRHGITEWNASRKVQGSIDIALSDEGLEQAQALARRLAGTPLQAIYSSDLQRAEQTARAIAEHQACPVQLDERLREIHCGSWEGLVWQDVLKLHPGVERDTLAGVDFPRSETGETMHDVVNRVMPAIEQIISEHPDGYVAVVSHGVVIATVVRCLLGMAPTPMRVETLANAATATIVVSEHGARLRSYNVVSD